MPTDRRRFLTLGGIALGALAGCSSQAPTDEGENAASTSTATTTAAPTETPTPSSDQPPGADVLGGPDDLQGDLTVDAATLSEDQGAGQFVFTPAVVWVESGTTIEWTISGGAHSVTSYHPNNDRSMRIPEGATAFDSGVLQAGETFEHTFEAAGVHNYYCTPHEGLGMVGIVIVDGVQGGPGTTDPSNVEISAAATNLANLLTVAGIGGEGGQASYGWQAATWDSYWYSLYNMSTNIAMSGNGITFPQPGNEEQVQTFQRRIKGIAQNADVDRPPVNKPNLNMAPFTRGDPHFTQQPVLSGEDGRPDASTLMWDEAKSSRTVSPSSLAWTQTKGVTWAKNFEQHFDVLPESIAPKFRSQVLTTMAQLGTKFALVDGNLRANEEDLTLVSGFSPGQGVTDDSVRLNHHSAMLWFLSDLVSLAENGWFGYVNPEPLIPVENLQKLADGMGGTTMTRFSPDSLSSASTRDVGQLLGAVGWYGTHAGSDEMAGKAAQYANGLANAIESNADGNGLVANGAENQAATQGIVGQGLVWASQLDGVDHSSTAESVLGYLFDELFDDDAGTFASGTDASAYRITTRDAGDITGGVNAAVNVLGLDVKDQYARFFNQTLNRGRLQRAERPPSRDENAEFTLPLPPAAGGEFGQAAVYNQAVEYDTSSQEWSVVDDSFVTADALYLANQELWVSQWGGSFFEGRGVPGQSDTPPQ